MIPQADPKRRFEELHAEVRGTIERVFARGQFILGLEVSDFEGEFARYLGAQHVVGVGSGTDALALAIQAVACGRGGEIVTVSLTSVATAVAIENAGAVPIFVDVDSATRCMDLATLEAAIGPRTVGIVPVHLHGFPAPMAEIMRIAEHHRLFVVEDCAQAHGADIDGCKVGTFGDAGAFSFYPTKNLGAAGDGGAVATSNTVVAERIRRLRFYGMNDSRIAVGPGSNHRLDELQAAILRVMLPRLDQQNEERRRLAAQFHARLDHPAVDLPPTTQGAVYHQFAVGVDSRDKVRAEMSARGVSTGVHYALGIHRHPHFARPELSLPVTDRLAARLISLPIQPEIARTHGEEICRALLESVRACQL